MVKFSIFIPTYNRQHIVINSVKSLLNQTYRDFEVFLVDNGSEQNIYNFVQPIIDQRFKFIRFEENRNVNDIAEECLANMSGSHFLFLGDDDALVPSTLEIIASIFEKNGDIEYLQVGLARFNHIARTWKIENYEGHIDIFNSIQYVLFFCNSWGIGSKQSYRGPKSVHPSGTFISKQLIDTTRKNQRELFLKPFGDVGYLGCCFNCEKIFYLDLPLAVIGEGHSRETDKMKSSQRRGLDKEAEFLEHSPVRGVSFINMATDIHLKVLYRNQYNEKFNCALRPDFYFRHLHQVISDCPWTWVTVRDIVECVPHMVISMFRFYTIIKFFSWFRRQFNLLTFKNFISIGKKSEPVYFDKDREGDARLIFKDINDFASWLDINFLGQKNLINMK